MIAIRKSRPAKTTYFFDKIIKNMPSTLFLSVSDFMLIQKPALMIDKDGHVYINIGEPSTTPQTVAYSIPLDDDNGDTSVILDVSEDNELLGIEILRLDLMIAYRSNGL